MQNTARNGRMSLMYVWIIAFVCFVSLSVLLITSFSLYDKVSDGRRFTINALVIPDYSATDDGFKIIPINYEALSNNERDRNEFLRMLVKQYIVNRYTVSSRTEIMENNLGLSSLGDVRTGLRYGSKLKRPAIMGIDENNQPNFSLSYRDFISGKDGERDEINQLLRDGVTRSVRIISEPQKVDDWIVTDVEFIYRTPTTHSLSEARKEVYRIAVFCKLRGLDFENMAQYDASSIFAFNVLYINKVKIN